MYILKVTWLFLTGVIWLFRCCNLKIALATSRELVLAIAAFTTVMFIKFNLINFQLLSLILKNFTKYDFHLFFMFLSATVFPLMPVITPVPFASFTLLCTLKLYSVFIVPHNSTASVSCCVTGLFSILLLLSVKFY